MQVCVHSSLPPLWPLGQWPALLSPMRSRLGNTLRTPHTHSSALSGTAVGGTLPEENIFLLCSCTILYFTCYLSDIRSGALYLQHCRRDLTALHQFPHVCRCVVGHPYGPQLPLGMQCLQCGPALGSVAWDQILNRTSSSELLKYNYIKEAECETW